MTELLAGATVAGKYRLERVIGRGGMGSVWAARHLQLDNLVALKFIDPLADGGDTRQRFEREAKAAAQLRSPHVVHILDHGLDGDRPYIAMELLEGEDLGERLRRVGKLSLGEAAAILTQAAKALRRAHEAGIIHRDLKPSNIFLARFDDDEVVKLLDFGVAKLRMKESDAINQMTQTGVIFGSPSYMSPEQARGNRVIDHRSDLWSLAVILFRAVTGVKPFEASSIGDLVIKLCIDPLPIPSKVAPGLPAELDPFFLRAFARDPDERFTSAQLMASTFAAIAEAEGSAARAAVAAAAPIAPATATLTPPSGESGGQRMPNSVTKYVELPSPPAAAVSPTASPIFGAPPLESPAAFAPPPMASSPSIPDLAGAPAPSPEPVKTAPPPSMTPSPAMLSPVYSPPGAPDHRPVILAAGLGAAALLLVAIAIGAVRRGGSSPASAEGADLPPAASSAGIPAPTRSVEPIPAVASGTIPEPAATEVPAPSGSAADDPAAPSSSAAAVPSGRPGKPGSGKPGRHTPNFGY